jgi:hypothetical protein
VAPGVLAVLAVQVASVVQAELEEREVWVDRAVWEELAVLVEAVRRNCLPVGATGSTIRNIAAARRMVIVAPPIGLAVQLVETRCRIVKQMHGNRLVSRAAIWPVIAAVERGSAIGHRAWVVVIEEAALVRATGPGAESEAEVERTELEAVMSRAAMLVAGTEMPSVGGPEGIADRARVPAAIAGPRVWDRAAASEAAVDAEAAADADRTMQEES